MIFAGDRIGSTAHYAGYVWARNGLSHPELATSEGRVLFDVLEPAMLPTDAVEAIWRPFARALHSFPVWRYISESEAALRGAGFASARVSAAADVVEGDHDPGARLAHILEASTK